LSTVKSPSDNLTANAYWIKKIDSLGGKYEFNITYSVLHHDPLRILNNTFLDDGDNMISENSLKLITPNHSGILSGHFDFSKRILKKVLMETGVKVSTIQYRDRYQMDSLKNGGWQMDPLGSSRAKTRENIYAGYINFRKSYKKFSTSFGARLQKITGKQTQDNLAIGRYDYLNLLPNLSVLYRINSSNNLNFSFNITAERPDFASISPFIINEDAVTELRGNVLLRQEKEYTSQLSYTYSGQRFTLFHTTYRNLVFPFVYFDALSNKYIIQEKNIRQGGATSLGYFHMFRVAKWWNLFATVYLSQEKYQTEINDQNIVSSHSSFFASISNYIKFTSTLNLNFSFRYKSPSAFSLYSISSIYAASVGLQKKLFHKKLSLSMNIDNMIYSDSRAKIMLKTSNTSIYTYRYQRVFALSISWSFSKGKPVETRDSELKDQKDVDRLNKKLKSDF
jgi:hypothetical protein